MKLIKKILSFVVSPLKIFPFKKTVLYLYINVFISIYYARKNNEKK